MDDSLAAARPVGQLAREAPNLALRARSVRLALLDSR